MTAIVGKGRTKDEGAIPVRVPRAAVIRIREGEAELAVGMKGVGGKVVGEAVKARPGREERIRALRVEKVEGNLRVGKKAIPEVVGEVRVGGG